MADHKSSDKSNHKKLVPPKPVITPPAHAKDLAMMSLALSASVKKVFFEKSETKFMREPDIRVRLITQFRNLMRIDAMEKFNESTVFAVVHLYKDAQDLEELHPIGLVIVHVERKYVPEMLRLLKYPYIEYDEDAEVLDGVGAIANLVGGQFRRELKRLGYVDLEMGPFASYINKVSDGIRYPIDQVEKYEINFDLDETKRLVLEMVMSPLPKARPI